MISAPIKPGRSRSGISIVGPFALVPAYLAMAGVTPSRSARLLGTMAITFVADMLGTRRGTLLHGSADGCGPAISPHRYGRRMYSGRPRSSIWFSALTAIATSVTRRGSVRDRRPSPMIRFKRLMSASTRARQL